MGSIPAAEGRPRVAGVGRALLPFAWLLASVGYFGPWIAHKTSALTLSGVDMAEFVKFLPGVLDGSLSTTRQLFYLPPLAIVVGVALLVGCDRLRYPLPVRILALLLAIPVSLQLLPPAWSPGSLTTAEFRLQTVALLGCWLLLMLFWVWGRLPLRATGSVAAAVAFAAAALSAWQFLTVKPAIDGVYGVAPRVGWGFYLCVLGLGLMALTAVRLAWRRRR
jgi:hypothetical protein